MNRFLFLLLSAAILFTYPGCKKTDDNSFRVDVTSDFQIRGGIGLNVPIEVRMPISSTQLEAELAVRGLTEADITDLYLNYLGLEILKPFGTTFYFLQQMELFVVAPGFPELLLASQYEFSGQQGTFIELEPTQTPIQVYFLSDQAELVLRFIVKDFVLQNLDVSMYQGYRVRAGDL